jgi:hypothetical protein
MNQTVPQGQPGYQASTAPVGQLNTKRGLVKFILLSIITCGIYTIVFYSGISSDINVIASRYDGKKTMHFCLLCFVVGPITAGIAELVWFHRISNRIGNEAKRRNTGVDFAAKDFWLWGVLGSLIIVGPFIYVYKLAEASNKIAESYNIYG